MENSSFVFVRVIGFSVLLASFSASAGSNVLLDRKEVPVDFASSILEVSAHGPRRIVLSGRVREVGTVCTSTRTIERTYIGCSVEDGQPNTCVTTFEECASEDFTEYSRNRKIVLKFSGPRPRAGTEIRLQAEDKDGYFTTPTLFSNDPCLKFEIREGSGLFARRKPLMLVQNECAKN